MRNAISMLFLAAASLHAQSIELRSGEIVAGRITSIGDSSLTLLTGYPTPAERSLAREDVEPRSWFAVLQGRANPSDAKAHLALAGTAEQLGLPGHAIAELQQAAQLDAALRTTIDTRIRMLRAKVAADLLVMAREAIAAGQLGEGKLTAQVVAEKYADTPSAEPARAAVAEAIKLLRTSAVAAAAGKPDAKLLAEAQALEQKADKQAPVAGGGIGASVKETKQREQSAKLFEQALATATRAGGGSEADAVRERIRGKLRDQYLAIATTLLQRRSLDRATAWNGMACALDPEHGGCHHLQDQIVQARLTFGY